MALLGRNDCFGGGGVEIPSHKKVIFSLFSCMLVIVFNGIALLKCKAKINCKIHVKSHNKV